jgi:hypothetical protein
MLCYAILCYAMLSRHIAEEHTMLHDAGWDVLMARAMPVELHRSLQVRIA